MYFYGSEPPDDPLISGASMTRPCRTLLNPAWWSHSVRLPPNKSAEEAKKTFMELCTKDVPNSAVIEVTGLVAGNGYLARDLDQWVLDVVDDASKV